MGTPHKENTKTGFTATDRKLLSGLSVKVANKHGCSQMYVHYIINGKRGTKSNKAQKIVKDLNALLELLRPEE